MQATGQKRMEKINNKQKISKKTTRSNKKVTRTNRTRKSIEMSVIGEFYDDYIYIKQELEKYIHIIARKDRARISQQILSRLMFLHFLQRQKLLNNDSKYFFNLFNGCEGNFYKDRLEPLFFDLLSGKKIASGVFGDVPFLNPGLFKKSMVDENYPDLVIDNEPFSKVLQFLDKWEWSIELSSKSRREVTPELLGYIFEKETNITNTLKYHDPGKSKKTAGQISKGAYYTPDYITSYITRETIENYLLNRINKSTDKGYRTFGDLLNETNMSIHCKLFEIITGLSVLDNAVGSGAFLLKALDVLLDIYTKILAHLRNSHLLGSDVVHYFPVIEKGYNIKKFIITENLFGVDVDDGAVETCKLRLWLNLIAELEKTSEGCINLFEPLPNIDYNIISGDSLTGVVKTKLELFETNHGEFNERLAEHVQNLREYKNVPRKDSTQLKKRINMDRKHFSEYLTNIIEEVGKENQLNSTNKFQWISHFPKQILQGGFDVIIGNPPYIRIHRLEEKKKKLFNQLFRVSSGQYDIYVLFFERSIALLRNGGVLGYITSSKYTTAAYGKKLREYILESTRILQLLDVSRIPVFKDAMVYPYITILTRDQDVTSKSAHGIKIGLNLTEEHFHGENIELLELPQRIFDSLEDRSFPIETAGKWEIIKKIHVGSKRLKDLVNISTGETGNLRKKIIVDKKRNDDHFPVIEGKNVSEFGINWTGKFINHDKSVISNPGEKWGFKNRKLFQQPKIVLKDISKYPQGALDESDFFCLNTLYFLSRKENALIQLPLKYILGIFNSHLTEFYFHVFFSGAHVSGGFLRFFKQYLEKIPIKTRVLPDQVNMIIKLVEELATLKTAMIKVYNQTDTKSFVEISPETNIRVIVGDLSFKTAGELLKTYENGKKKLNNLIFDTYDINDRERERIIEFLKTKRRQKMMFS
jgi:hypothetical protein